MGVTCMKRVSLFVFVRRQTRAAAARDAYLSSVYVSIVIMRHGCNDIDISVGPDQF